MYTKITRFTRAAHANDKSVIFFAEITMGFPYGMLGSADIQLVNKLGGSIQIKRGSGDLSLNRDSQEELHVTRCFEAQPLYSTLQNQGNPQMKGYKSRNTAAKLSWRPLCFRCRACMQSAENLGREPP